MNKLNLVSIKLVRWSGWLLLAVVLAFLVTGYIMSGRYGLSNLLDERTALTLHKLLHLPLCALLLAHAVPAVYLAVQRWGWVKRRSSR